MVSGRASCSTASYHSTRITRSYKRRPCNETLVLFHVGSDDHETKQGGHAVTTSATGGSIWNFSAGALAVMFIIYITAKGELGSYIQLLLYSRRRLLQKTRRWPRKPAHR